MEIDFYSSIDEIDEHQWNDLWATAYPFTQYAFFCALEASKSIGAQTGWQPLYVVAHKNTHLQAAMPLFIKDHSYGEYVFDWSWANAYAQLGMEYYPKVINAIPFTPATGPRIGFHFSLSLVERQSLFERIVRNIKMRILRSDMSGFHCLFPGKDSSNLWDSTFFKRRDGHQFHWFNRNEKGSRFASFDEFLQTFNSRKRKSLKKEREKVNQQNINVQMKSAEQLSKSEWDTFYALYHRTYLKRSGSAGYLGSNFFHLIAKAFPTQVVVACAYAENELIAAALYFQDEDTLYGRYWGTKVDLDGLHFEACYYQGIEHAIKKGLYRFDPGAQGEHKIQRGFTPVTTCSYHWLANDDLNRSITHFLEEEKKHNSYYIDQARQFLPFKDGFTTVDCECLIDAKSDTFM